MLWFSIILYMNAYFFILKLKVNLMRRVKTEIVILGASKVNANFLYSLKVKKMLPRFKHKSRTNKCTYISKNMNLISIRYY